MGSGMPDYSEGLTQNRVVETEIEWSKMDRKKLWATIIDLDPESVIEFCCGTGWIPMGLPPDIKYLGIDANRQCIALASAKNFESRVFFVQDIRKTPETEVRDLSLAFSCLKHFPLAEWDDIYSKVLSLGRMSLTSIFMGPEDHEDETRGFPHTQVTMDRVIRVAKDAGHSIVRVFTLPPLNKQPEPLVLTQWAN